MRLLMDGEAGCQDGPGLLLGGVVGIRRWKIHKDGSLRGITYNQPWNAGENVAECWRLRYLPPEPEIVVTPNGTTPASDAAAKAVVRVGYAGIWAFARWGWSGLEWDDVGSPVLGLNQERNDCGLPIGRHQDCGHGFYAYTDPKTQGSTNQWSGIWGVIEGYGRMLLGSNGGFKAEKARIVALHIPPVSEAVREGEQPVEKYSKDQEYWVRATEAVKARYPEVFLYSTRERMLDMHPLSDISHLTDEP